MNDYSFYALDWWQVMRQSVAGVLHWILASEIACVFIEILEAKGKATSVYLVIVCDL